MSKPRSIKGDSPAAFNDCKYLMDLAVKKSGLTYECESVGQAIKMKQRCNTYRNLLRTIQQEQLDFMPGQWAVTIYDILVIRLIDDEGKSVVKGLTVRFDHTVLKGVIRDAEGNVIEIPDGFSFLDDEE